MELSEMECACGCGAVMKPRQRFVKGHNRRSSIESRIMVRDMGHDTPCWIWPTENGHGYPAGLHHGGRRMAAHRAVYIQRVGPIPDGLQLDHLCRVTACVNPAHLEPVTPKENTHRSGATILSDEQVREIVEFRRRFFAENPVNSKGQTRMQLPNRASYDIAHRYGVAPATVRKIWQREGRASWI